MFFNTNSPTRSRIGKRMESGLMVAYLIMAHKNPEQVNRLIRGLKANSSVCFIHIDSRASFGPDIIVDAVPVRLRHHGVLGSYSLVQIADELMKRAKEYETEHNIHFHYFCLLSGQDYLLKHPSAIADELERTYPKALIDCDAWNKGNWVAHGSKNSQWCVEAIRKADVLFPASRPMRRLMKAPIFVINMILRHFTTAQKKLARKGIQLYGGSAWWILPDYMVDYCLEETQKFGKTSRFYPIVGVWVPEEHYYQTLLLNSKFKNEVVIKPPDAPEQNCKTYAHFLPEGKPFTGHPYILTMEDRDLLQKLSAKRFFARKFDMSVDSDILDWIDKNLLQNVTE